MRTTTSFAILALLASAGTTFGAPVQHDSGSVAARGGALQQEARHHGHEDQGRHGSGHGNGHGHHAHDERDLITAQILPNSPLVSGKDGVSDTKFGNISGHVIQTPGKDKTLADVVYDDGNPAHKTDTKVNVPADGPGSGLTGVNDKGQYGNAVSQLVGKPADGPGEVIDLPPYAEIGIQSQEPAPSKAAQSSAAPKPAKSSNAPKPAQSSHAPKPAQSSEAPKPASSSNAPKPAQSSNAPKPAQSSAAPKPAQSSQAPKPAKSSQAPKPSQSSQAPKPAQSSAAPKPAQSSKAPKPAQSSHAAKPAQSSTAPKPQPSQQSGSDDIDDDYGFYGAGGFLPSRPGKGNNGGSGSAAPKPSASSAPHKGNSHPSSGNSGHKNPHGGSDDDGFIIGLSSATRRGEMYDFKYAKVEYGKIPEHVRPCDDLREGKHGEYLDMCIEADLLDYAPKHTVKCPDEMQREIHYSEDTGADPALQGQLGKDVAKYVRLCVAAGSL